MQSPVEEGQPRQLEERAMTDLAARFRETLAADGRATKLTQLFDYMLERSADSRAPKEIEIAIAVFGKTTTFDTSQESTVRSHVYRLRQRLEQFNRGMNGARLHIPKGEYRLVLLQDPDDPMAGERDRPPAAPGTSRAHRLRLVTAVGAFASVLAWATLWTAQNWPEGRSAKPTSVLGQTALWRPIALHPQGPVVAVSDFYMVAEDGPDGRIARLVMHPEIQSPLALDRYLGQRPALRQSQHDRDIYRVPSSIAAAAVSMLSLTGAMRSDRAMGEIVPVSKLSQAIIDTRNVIYFAPVSQLGKLRSPIQAMSNFAPGADLDEIRDTATGQRYRAIAQTGQSGAAPAESMGYDYGYITSFRGRAGNQSVMISGIADAALAQMMHIVADRGQLDALARRVGDAPAFEALYQFRTAGGLVFETRLLTARPMVEPAGISGKASLR